MRFLKLIQLLLHKITLFCGSYVLRVEWNQTPLACRIIICAFLITQVLCVIGSVQSLVTRRTTNAKNLSSN